MAIEVIKQLQDKVETLTTEAKEAKEKAAAAIEAAKKEFEEKYGKELEDLKKELEERKTSFGESGIITADQVKRIEQEGINLYVKSLLTGKPVDSFAEFKDVAGKIEKAIKPADVTAWLAETFSNQVLEELAPELMVEKLFKKINFPKNTSQFSIPGIVDETVAYLIAPEEDAIASAVAAAKVTFATQRIKTLIGVTDQADNESLTALVEIVRQRLIQSIAKASEKALILGKDKDAGYGANDVREAFTGLMKYARGAGQTVDAAGGAVSSTLINNARKLLGVAGLNPADLVIVTDYETAFEMIDMAEVKTVDQYGPNATILKGEIGKIWGISLVVSGFMHDKFTAAGEDDEATGSHRALMVVNKNYFLVADRGNVSIEVQRNSVSSTNLYVGFRDLDFKNIAINAVPVAAVVNIGS